MSSTNWFILLGFLFVFIIGYNVNKDFIGANQFLIKKDKWVDGEKPLPIVKIIYVEPMLYTRIDINL